MSDFPPIANLIPHTGPMVLLDRMVAWEEGDATCTFTVRARAPFVTPEGLEAPLLMEHMAQSVAACLGYEAFRGGEGVRVGMVIGCRRFDVEGAAFVPVGAHVSLHAERIRGSESLSHFECVATAGDERIASAQLTVFHAESPPE